MSTAAESGAPPRRRPRDRKQQILTAARDLFIERGYPNVTMAQIAERVGITAGALYRHFSKKSVLLDEVIAENFAWIDEPVPSLDYDDTIDYAISVVIDRPYLSDLWTHEIRYLPEEALRDVRRRMRAWNQSLIPAIRRRRPDLDPGQLDILTFSMQSLMSCVGRRAMHSPLSLRLPAVRAGLRVVVTAELSPTGTQVEPPGPRLVPQSMRERLLMAAVDQFGERGYQETSMASIGAAADVTGPNLYSYFESKADLLRAVLERGTHSLWLGLDQALADSQTPDDALRRFVSSYVSRARSWAAILEDPTGEYEMEEVTKSTQREYVAEWVALLQQIHPALDRRQARVRVQLALFLVADLHRNRRLVRDAAFLDNLTAVVLAVLLDGSMPEPAKV